MVVVRPNLSKAGHRYFTFLGAEGCGYLTEYLRLRAEAGEKLTPETDLIHPEASHSTHRGIDAFIRTINVSDGIRLAIRKAGLPWRPYVLRAYFDTQLLLSESKGKVAHDYRVFWMGHKGSMEARYTTNKGRLSANFVDDMREAYQRCEVFLTTLPVEANGPDAAAISKMLLMGLGYTEEELAKADLADLSVVQGLVAQKMGTRATLPARQKVVDGAELSMWLEEGWTVVTALGLHQVVLNPPGSGQASPTHRGGAAEPKSQSFTP